ncbi:MAG: 5-bromo-4-chloroindolyl phosphate hydrolysis family protein, partial [Lactococcus sp.]|nr:5-bromo-4-chloroindolyl phosphate hydrolysis family protein [Lactococcus sp.]
YKNDKKNQKLIKTYHKAGLSDQDIVIFRQTMQDAKNQIKQWEIAVKEDAALQVIEQVTGGLDSAKKLFQLIVKRPKIALSNNDFLYKHLPTMLDLIETYQNIKAVDKLDQALLVDSQKVIRVLSEKVAGLYALTVSDDIETIKNEVENG